MTDQTNNPPADQVPAPPGKALKITRLLIAVGLCVGIGVFAVYAIEELKAGAPRGGLPTDFGASDTSPGQQAGPAVQSNNPFAALATTDQSKYIPIDRDNPNPGQIVPFMNAAPYGQPPYKQPIAGNEVWELCVYQVKDASIAELIGYYNRQARRRGMQLTKQQPTSDNMPGGVVAAWSNGPIGLQVTVNPLPLTEPVQPPLAPPTPLRWVVKYSYPNQPDQP
ncbi:MAG: hypothetical protein AAGB26_10735 [Planctomycetota bacterium]